MMEKAAREELESLLVGVLCERYPITHRGHVARTRTLFADYDALEEKHRLCGTKIAAQKGIVQGLRTKLAAETERCVKVVSRHLGAIIGEGLNKDGQAVGEAWNDLEAAMREGR